MARGSTANHGGWRSMRMLESTDIADWLSEDPFATAPALHPAEGQRHRARSVTGPVASGSAPPGG
jgi:hypothetical protein